MWFVTLLPLSILAPLLTAAEHAPAQARDGVRWHPTLPSRPATPDVSPRITAGFDGDALAWNGTKASQLVVLRTGIPETNVHLPWPTGSIRLWLRSDWGCWAADGIWNRILDAGAIRLTMLPSGKHMAVETLQPGGAEYRTNHLAELPWNIPMGMFDRCSRWHEIILMYSTERTILIVDGDSQKDLISRGPYGAGVPGSVPSIDLSEIVLGSGKDGANPLKGAIGPVDIGERKWFPFETDHWKGLTLLTRSDPGVGAAVSKGMGLRWWFDAHRFRARDLTTNTLYRRETSIGAGWAGSREGWARIGSFTNTLSCTDPSTQPGTMYEYRLEASRQVTERFLLGGENLPETTSWGRVLLLVETKVAAGISKELLQLRQDLAGDGWDVAMRTAPAHDDAPTAGGENGRKSLAIKQIIQQEAQQSSNTLRAVFLIGHVAIPYSGGSEGPEDGHVDHGGAWPADSFYGDLDGEYSDALTVASTAPEPLRNLPNDGKWDQDSFPENRRKERGMELAVGRVDFARLPVLGARSEISLLKGYLEKDHRYRWGLLQAPTGVVVGTYFGDPFHLFGLGAHANALRASYSLGRGSPDSPTFGDCFVATNRCLIGIQSGYGAYDAINNNPEMNTWMGCTRVSTPEFARPERPSPAFMFVLTGSYFGDWNLPDNLMRATLGGADLGLLACWGFGLNFRFDRCGLGAPVGDMFVATSRGTPGYFVEHPIGYGSTRTLALLGDPTLRFFVTLPPKDLSARKQGGKVRLTWAPGAVGGNGPPPELYHVYRSGAAEGPWKRLTSHLVSVREFIDAQPQKGNAFYAVKTAERVAAHSGSFTNLSQAAWTQLR